MGIEPIAAMLKRARIDANRSVKEVSDYLYSVDISVAVKTIYGWESGRSQPDIDTFLALCRFYGIKPEAFSKLGQLVISDHEARLSDEVLEVAKAYENAELKNKNIARQALDLPLLPEQSHPYMLRVAARGQGVFDVPLERPLTEEDFEKLEEAAAKTMEDYGDL